MGIRVATKSDQVDASTQFLLIIKIILGILVGFLTFVGNKCLMK